MEFLVIIIRNMALYSEGRVSEKHLLS